MELQSDTGRIALTYYAKAVNIVASGKDQTGTVTDDGVELSCYDRKIHV